MSWKRYFPITEWLPGYNKKDFRGDLVAGLTVTAMLVPQAMAYGLLAGLPPIYGLYASIVPLLLYAFFGTSRQLSVGPVALVSLLVLAGVGEFAEPYSGEFIRLAIATAFIAGIIQLLLGVFRLGFLINFLSHPVISGFTSAAAVIIAFSQIKNLLGVNLPRSNRIYEIIIEIVDHLGAIHLPTLLIGLGSIALMLLLKRIGRSLPGAFIVIVIGTALVSFSGLEEAGVEVVGKIPAKLPAFSVPSMSIQNISELLPLALTICLISFIESLAIAKTIESKHKSYRVIPNQELIALGLTKVGGAFFQSFPTTGSFTRTAINDESGARTGISSIISALLVALTLLLFTPLFYHLPKAVLAAIIIVAVTNLIEYEKALKLWKNDRRDFLTLIVTFLATLSLGIQTGVLIGVILSLAIIIYQNSRPHIAILGRLPKTTSYRNISRFGKATEEQGVLILRFDAQLYFGNAEFFRETIEELVSNSNDQIKLLILDASNIHDIDSSALHILHDVLDYLKSRKIKFFLSGVIGPVRDILFKSGMADLIGEKNQFLKIHDAIVYHHSQQEGAGREWSSDAIQTNFPKSNREEERGK